MFIHRRPIDLARSSSYLDLEVMSGYRVINRSSKILTIPAWRPKSTCYWQFHRQGFIGTVLMFKEGYTKAALLGPGNLGR